MGQTYARLIGLAMTLLGIWIVAINLIEGSYSGGIWVWVLGSGALGAIGGVLYLMSFDGPDRFRTGRTRLAGWLGMLVLALLPWSFTFLVVPMVVLAIPTLIAKPEKAGVQVTLGGKVFTLVRSGNRIRVLRDMGDDMRVEVVGNSADSDTLLRLAEEIGRGTGRNR